jgi:hypothetical protein
VRAQALSALPGATFQGQLPRLFPLLTALITADHTSPEVQRALAELFLGRVGPLLAAAGGSSSNGVSSIAPAGAGAGDGGSAAAAAAAAAAVQRTVQYF